MNFNVGNITTAFSKSNFRFRYAWLEKYGEYNHIHMFIVGERAESSGIEFINEMAHGHEECHLRFWYVDIEMPEQWRFLHNIPYEYPIPVSPVAIAYDGIQFIYVIYNKYNIWRLNFKKVLEDPNGSWWNKLPPCIDCNFLGDDRTSPIWNTYFIPPRYLTLFSKDGKMARMDTETFVWFLDKNEAPAPAITQKEQSQSKYVKSGSLETKLQTVTGIDNDELYMIKFGGISGKVLNVYDRQWDNFFFDMRQTKEVVKYYNTIIDDNLWPTAVKRKRLYTFNHLGHLFYSWIRIDGLFDVEYQIDDFFDVSEARIYADNKVLYNWENLEVQVFTITSGWVTIDHIHFQAIINEIDWDWDGNYWRRYVRMRVNEYGDVSYQYTKCPPNYVKVNLTNSVGEPISKIRVKFKPVESPHNYIARINRVELISNQEIMNIYDSPVATAPVEIINIEPMESNEDYSMEFAVTIKNKGDAPVRDIISYVFENEYIQFTKTPNDDISWIRATEKNPFYVIDILDPGQETQFFIRGINKDMLPHICDLTVIGVYPFEG